MALVETCFSRLTGQFGDYSEQQLIDCGYGQNGGAGCEGAPPHAYVKWAAEHAELGLLHESDYPYANTQPTYTCPADLGGTLSGIARPDLTTLMCFSPVQPGGAGERLLLHLLRGRGDPRQARLPARSCSNLGES